jgi:hypothetical protein
MVPPWRKELAEEIVQKPIALGLHERPEISSFLVQLFFIEIEVLARPFAIDLCQSPDHLGRELQMEKKAVCIPVGKGLISAQSRSRQQ